MRYLHAVGTQEAFIASGVYQYTLLNRPHPYTETWTMHRVGEGTLIRIDQDSREVKKDSWSRLAEVLVNEAGQVERYTYLHLKPAGSNFTALKVDYVFLGDYIQATRRVDNGEREYHEIPAPPNLFVRLIDYELLWGATLLMVNHPDKDNVPVFVPFYLPNVPTGQVLAGMLPAVTDIAPDTLHLGEREIVTIRYQTSSRVIWLNDENIPVKVQQTQQPMIATLTNYGHRPKLESIDA